MVGTTVALAAVVCTLAAFAALGTWYSRGRVASAESYVSARDSTGGVSLAATLFASSMGAWVLLSPVEAGASFGGLSAVVGYAVGSALPLLAYAVVGPRIRAVMPAGHSLTEYARARYGRAMYAFVTLVTVFYMFIFLAAEMTGVVGALSLVAGVPAWVTAALVGGFVLAYTGYGGLRASIFTDGVQTVLLVPLLGATVAGGLAALGGPASVAHRVAATDPSLLDPTFGPGVAFGVYVAVAVLGAEMCNQSWWQRVYAAEDAAALRRGFLAAAVAVVPVVLTAGLFGVAARGLGYLDAGEASVAFFVLVVEAFPGWAALAVVLVALVLVMSTADTLFNALASVVTTDLARATDAADDTLLLAARAFTAVVALLAVVVGARGYSVLTLFFAADLLATATFLPLLAGLFTGRTTGPGALVASVAGLVVGLAYFPPVAVAPAPSFFAAFVGAAAVSGLGTLLASVPDGEYEFSRLAEAVRRF